MLLMKVGSPAYSMDKRKVFLYSVYRSGFPVSLPIQPYGLSAAGDRELRLCSVTWLRSVEVETNTLAAK